MRKQDLDDFEALQAKRKQAEEEARKEQLKKDEGQHILIQLVDTGSREAKALERTRKDEADEERRHDSYLNLKLNKKKNLIKKKQKHQEHPEHLEQLQEAQKWEQI